MVRETPNHGWEVQEPGEADYVEKFDNLIDDIDDVVALRGPVDERPEAGREGRLYISTDESPQLLYYDTGDEWAGIKGELNVPDNVAEIDANEEVQGSWTFHVPIDGNLEGKAKRADTADMAELAESAQKLGGVDGEKFAKREDDEDIQGEWTFEDVVNIQNGISIEGTIDLPRYNGEDPDNPQPGAMWFREDHQPTS